MITLSQVSGSDVSPSSPVQQGTIQASYLLSATQTGALSPSGFEPSPPSIVPSSGIGSGGQLSMTAPSGPASGPSSPSGSGVDPSVNALINLAAMEFAAGGGSITGGGGVVALPTPIDTSSSTTSSTSGSGKAAVVLLFIAGIGYYFYKKHKKAA